MSTDQPFHQESIRQPNWKPPFFNALYILSLVTLHILCIVGIQLLIKKYDSDQLEISLVQQNATVTNPRSIFIFDENNTGAFLAWQYLPVAIATFLGILWESLDVNVRRLEPFHQLSRSEGGNTRNAMCLDYISMFSLIVPFSAMRKRHYVVAASSFIYILAASVIPTLTGGMWSIEWASLSYSSEKTEGPKFATMSVNTGVVIATQVVHGLIATLGTILSWALLVRRTGLYCNPKGIGGIAALISEADHCGSNTLRLFRQLPSFAHSKVLAGSLQGITFQLRHLPVVRANGATYTTYQLAANTHPVHTLPLRREDRAYYQDRRDAMGRWLFKRAVWIAECFLWLGQAAIAGVIYHAAKLVGPDSLVDRTKPTIAKMVYTLCITIGGMMWQSIQRDVQLFEPWRQMSRGQGRSIYAALVQSDVVSLGLLASAVVSMARLSLIALWATFSVVMVKVATVFMPPLFELIYAAGIDKNSPFPRHEFGVVKGSKAQALGATAVGMHLIIFCNLLFLLGSGRTRPFLPRQPTTIASQILYLCHSEKLLADFAGTSMVSNEELVRKLRYVDRTCLFGWFWWQRGQAWYVGVEEYGQGDTWAPFDFGNGIYGYQPCT
ncbi:hypothetical protein K469DRAFT_650033 [Zopfia rhizophila CBS 207.26]|uniref:Uncharacterized protein n=1 Tax=Zopfia rhizophila CBS 207.26 TaxID=1314779 RepID=A0A6A6EWC0_9PEZI|nr:hypothetical protein K469DRAFT_650033 [Zopfia rhizophila CBS 207.26]